MGSKMSKKMHDYPSTNLLHRMEDCEKLVPHLCPVKNMTQDNLAHTRTSASTRTGSNIDEDGPAFRVKQVARTRCCQVSQI